MTTLLVGLLDQASAQDRRSRSRRAEADDSSLPQQRTPLPVSELDLGSVPYRIVYESLRDTGGESNWELIIMNADGSNARNLTNTPDVDEHYPHASPDGSRILFVAIEGEGRRDRTRAVYYMNVDGTGKVKVAENAYQPNWSGDGRSIAYLPGEYERFSSDMTSNQGLVIYDLETGAARTHPEDDLEMLYNLTWSPDGQWFVATSRGGRRGNILFEASSAGTRSLSIQGCRPDISPDGARIAWGRTDQELRIGAFDPTARGDNVVDQTPVVVVDRREKVYHVDWSPDGRYLAFSYGPSRGGQAVGQRAEGWNISIYDVVQEKWVQVTTDGSHNKEPDWVPIR
jgi:Tol biopolymer transport system component